MSSAKVNFCYFGTSHLIVCFISAADHSSRNPFFSFLFLMSLGCMKGSSRVSPTYILLVFLSSSSSCCFLNPPCVNHDQLCFISSPFLNDLCADVFWKIEESRRKPATALLVPSNVAGCIYTHFSTGFLNDKQTHSKKIDFFFKYKK